MAGRARVGRTQFANAGRERARVLAANCVVGWFVGLMRDFGLPRRDAALGGLESLSRLAVAEQGS